MTDEESFERLNLIAEKTKVLFSKLENLSGYNIPARCPIDFKELQKTITSNPLPSTLKRLESNSTLGRDWLTIFRSASLGNIQEGLIASYYHLENIEKIEKEMIDISLQEVKGLDMRNSSVGGGNTRKLNFEYQAFVFALRRTLEYLAMSIASFFKCEGNRIRKIDKTITGQEPIEISDKIRALVSETLIALSDILPQKSDGLSVRDTLAHWKSVDAGTFNISGFNDEIIISLVGGGEKIKMNNPAGQDFQNQLMKREDKTVAFISLTPIIENQISRVESLILKVFQEMQII